MRDELFLLNDPRYLSGGEASHYGINYANRPPRIMGDVVRSSSLAVVSGTSTADKLHRLGQDVHGGKTGYHSRPHLNLFLAKGTNPTAGVEIETVAKVTSSEHCARLERALTSNWFHAERDGSLDPDHGGQYGYEWITEPLPPRVYRDPRTWIGFQNLMVPWVSSFDRPECGLHVHVGLEQFEGAECATLAPIRGKSDRRTVGKYLSAFVYYALLDQAFIDRVVLRKATSYCAPSCPDGFADGFVPGMTAAGVVDLVVSKMYRASLAAWRDRVSAQRHYLSRDMDDRDQVLFPDRQYLPGFEGHGVEINCSHPYTVEFRRGKGTLQGISIHRMVELMTLIVRFAWKMAREPQLRVERADVYRWMAANTTSAALRGMAEREICA